MRIVYLGTPDFSVLPLKSISECAEFEIVGVVCNRDKEVGRKKILTPPPVKEFALSKGYKVYQYDSIRDEGVEDMKALQPDVMVTCAFGQILSQEVLGIAKHGVINVHASLLPKYRGASPVHQAIKDGETQTGITVMKTDIGIDTGDIIYAEKLDIKEDETCGELFERLSCLGAECIVKALKMIKNGTAIFTPQDNSKSTRTGLVKKEHAKIDWEDTAKNIVNQIRAYNPSPVAYTFLNGEPLKIYSAKVSNGKGKAGEILNAEKQLEIACGDGSIIIKTLQKAGSKMMEASDFLRGTKLIKGDIIG